MYIAEMQAKSEPLAVNQNINKDIERLEYIDIDMDMDIDIDIDRL